MTCAHAVRVAIEKLPGVETAGVELNRGTVKIALQPGNPLTLARLMELIRKQGHVTRKVRFQARARLAAAQSNQLEILGTGETVRLDAARVVLPENIENIGKPLRVTAEASIPKDSPRLPPLAVLEAIPEP